MYSILNWVHGHKIKWWEVEKSIRRYWAHIQICTGVGWGIEIIKSLCVIPNEIWAVVPCISVSVELRGICEACMGTGFSRIKRVCEVNCNMKLPVEFQKMIFVFCYERIF